MAIATFPQEQTVESKVIPFNLHKDYQTKGGILFTYSFKDFLANISVPLDYEVQARNMIAKDVKEFPTIDGEVKKWYFLNPSVPKEDIRVFAQMLYLTEKQGDKLPYRKGTGELSNEIQKEFNLLKGYSVLRK